MVVDIVPTVLLEEFRPTIDLTLLARRRARYSRPGYFADPPPLAEDDDGDDDNFILALPPLALLRYAPDSSGASRGTGARDTSMFALFVRIQP